MEIRSPRMLKADASEILSATADHRKIALIWAGVSAMLSLLVAGISFLLDAQIAETGGLGGIGLRSVLDTAQSALAVLTGLFAPFWTLGYTGSILRLSRKQPVAPSHLLGGLLRLGPAVRMMILRYFLLMGIVILGFYGGLLILGMTPLADPVYEILNANESFLTTGIMDDATMAALLQAMLPTLIICGILAMLLFIPFSYRLRLADFCIMDDPACGARMAIRKSMRMMHGRRRRLFALDLSFWWYYLAQLLLLSLCYGDVILAALSITLPFSADAAYFIFGTLALAAQVLLYYRLSNHVQTTYALFYNDALPQETEQAIMPL